MGIHHDSEDRGGSLQDRLYVRPLRRSQDPDRRRAGPEDMTRDRFVWIIKGLDFDNLNDWEIRFVSEMENRMKWKGDLTERQEEILERIFQERQ